MILTGSEIIKQVEKGKIKIDPFNLEQINPNSYNFRMGDAIKFYVNPVLDPKIKQEVREVHINSDGYTLYPGRIYLGHTLETMGSDYYVPMVKGRSSTARLGLFIHVTADIIDIGSYNQWTLQLYAVQPVKVYSHMLIGQVTFWTVVGEIELYKGKYQGSKGPYESQIYKDFIE
ncbi:MAG: dCTP deaminase [Deltaproteobacteria bacterium]|nr:dCTP deaminase [Deltaproteobacteria bacterium]